MIVRICRVVIIGSDFLLSDLRDRYSKKSLDSDWGQRLIESRRAVKLLFKSK